MKELEGVACLLILAIVLVALVLGIFALGALIIWGVGNAIIYLFAIPIVWTYWKSCVTIFLIWGLRKILKFCFK